MSPKRPGAAVRAGIVATTVAAGMLAASPAHALVGDQATDGQYTFTAEITVGDDQRSCSGALVAPQWVATAASCFTDDPAQWNTVAAGKPATPAVATIGRTDLTDPTGHVSDIVELVPRADRDLVLARLARPATGIQPVALSDDAPAATETLTAAGYGRTADVWVPGRLHTSTFTVDSTTAGSMALSGATADSALCKGDTGGPLLRDTGTGVELVAVNSRSWQGGCLGSEETRTGAVSSRLDDLTGWINTTTTAAPLTDFNCDGLRDVAVGDPEATVGTDVNAGLVRIIYGGGKGTAEITQDLDAVPGGSEAGDWFGERLDVFDHNEDGCSDLVVGVPAEDLGGASEAGMASVLFGDRDGLTEGRSSLNYEQEHGDGTLGKSASEAGDRLGDAVAAGHTTTGEPYLLLGIPGEDHSGYTDAGTAVYVHDGTDIGVTQDSTGVAGDPENGDRFGASIAGSPQHFAVGAPGEDLGTAGDAGMTETFGHTLTEAGTPTALATVAQDNPAIPGSTETGDRVGETLAMVAYRPAGSPFASDSLLVVGAPGEDIDGHTDAGGGFVLQVTASGDYTTLTPLGQDMAEITGGAENGDRFGATLTAVNTAPGKVGTADTLLLAVGSPGEDLAGVEDAGVVQVVPLLGAPGASDVWLEAGESGMPGDNTNVAEAQLGSHLTATGTHLYVGMPYGPSPYGAVHTVPWANLLDGATQPVTTYQPGEGGIPAIGGGFGRAMQ